MKPARPAKLKPRPTSVSIPEDLEPQLLEARRLTRESASTLLVLCARRSLAAVVRQLLRQQQREARAYLARRTRKIIPKKI